MIKSTFNPLHRVHNFQRCHNNYKCGAGPLLRVHDILRRVYPTYPPMRYKVMHHQRPTANTCCPHVSMHTAGAILLPTHHYFYITLLIPVWLQSGIGRRVLADDVVTSQPPCGSGNHGYIYRIWILSSLLEKGCI